jgi:hypothetical protein
MTFTKKIKAFSQCDNSMNRYEFLVKDAAYVQ